MGKVDEYRQKIRGLSDWDSFLLAASRLPGPRANLELAFAVASEGSEEQFVTYAAFGPAEAPENSKEEFLAFCGVMGLGYLAARGNIKHLDQMRERASDPRWRIREAVALGLQKYGTTSFDEMFACMIDWSAGSLLERRAVVAALCEPGLLREKENASRILDILDRITMSLLQEEERRSHEFRVLRKALGYGWSVAVVAHPAMGKLKMEPWIQSGDSDVLWIMENNLKKNRMRKMDAAWVEAQLKAASK